MSVTRFGVSLLNVVATIESPASHHGTERPDTKNSEVLLPARRLKNSDGMKQIASEAKTIIQSINCKCMAASSRLAAGENRHKASGLAASHQPAHVTSVTSQTPPFPLAPFRRIFYNNSRMS